MKPSGFVPSALLLFAGVLIYSVCPAFAEPTENGNSKNGIVLSEYLFTLLEENALSPEVRFVAPDGFAYNILVSFAARIDDEPQEASIEDAVIEAPPIDTLVITISQDECLAYSEKLISFLHTLQEMELPVQTQILLAAGDVSRLPRAYQANMPAGSRAFVNSLDDPEKVCAITLLAAPSGPYIIPGSHSRRSGTRGIIAPLWLLKQLPFEIFGHTPLLYRLNLTRSELRLAVFSESGSPSAGIRFDPNDEAELDAVFSGLLQFAASFSGFPHEASDINYSIILSGLGNIPVTERQFINVYLILAGFILVLLCASPFFFKKTWQQRKKDIFTTWYILPLTLLLAALSLSLGQRIGGEVVHTFFSAGSRAILVRFLIKVGAPFVVLSLFFLALSIVRTIIPTYAYSVWLTVAAILNIFLFGAVEPAFLLLFAAEYAVIYFSRLFFRPIPLTICAAVLVVPFLPFVRLVSLYAGREELSRLISCSFGGNLLFAFALAPFFFMWFRLLSFKHTLARFFAFCGAAAVIFAVGATVLSKTAVFSSADGRAIPPLLVVRDEDPSGVRIEAQARSFFELDRVTVKAGADLPIVRCDISVLPLAGTPTYNSTAPFSVRVADGSAHFNLPEHPPNPLSIVYITDKDNPAEVSAVFFLLAEDGTVIRKEHSVRLHQSATP